MALAYLIMAHKSPDQILRLIRALQDRDSFFVVHIDARAGEDVYGPLREYAATHPEVLLARRHRCYWGAFGIASAMVECVRATVGSGRAFDYAILLSGQDYPIKHPAQIHEFLRNSNGSQFIQSFSLVKPNQWTNHGGYFQAEARVRYWTFFLRSRVFHLKWKRKFPFNWEPFGGSQWWCLSSDCMQYIAKFLKDNPAFLRYFKYVFIPDESLFQTILSNSPFRDRIIDDNLRYIDWDHPNPDYPRTLESDDFEKLVSSPKLFARKFQPGRSSECMDSIDARILGQTAPVKP